MAKDSPQREGISKSLLAVLALVPAVAIESG
jgi:hypothetical protein